MKPTFYMSLAVLSGQALAMVPQSETTENLTESCVYRPTSPFPGTIWDLDPETTVHVESAATSLHKRTDKSGDRRHAQYTAHSKVSGCPNCLSTGFCGDISTISEFQGGSAPPRDECELIREWLTDHANQGYWSVSMDRLQSIPWVPLITAGSCTVVVADDRSIGERDGLIIGTKDVSRVMETAIWDHERNGTVGVTGSWDSCAAVTYGSDSLAGWSTKFQLMVKSQVP